MSSQSCDTSFMRNWINPILDWFLKALDLQEGGGGVEKYAVHYSNNIYHVQWLIADVEPLCCILLTVGVLFNFLPCVVSFVALEDMFYILSRMSTTSREVWVGPYPYFLHNFSCWYIFLRLVLMTICAVSEGWGGGYLQCATVNMVVMLIVKCRNIFPLG